MRGRWSHYCVFTLIFLVLLICQYIMDAGSTLNRFGHICDSSLSGRVEILINLPSKKKKKLITMVIVFWTLPKGGRRFTDNVSWISHYLYHREEGYVFISQNIFIYLIFSLWHYQLFSMVISCKSCHIANESYVYIYI